MKLKILFFTAIITCLSPLANADFQVIALGIQGGVDSDNLTSYLIKSDNESNYLGLDAGTTITGIEKAIKFGSFPELNDLNTGKYSQVGFVLNNLISSYWISHAHLDHVAGLVIASPEEDSKNIYGSTETIDYLSNNYFNWVVWPNLTNIGRPPRLGKFNLQAKAMRESFEIAGTGLTGYMYPLNHGGYISSMILIKHRNESFAFFGDTGSDSVQKTNELHAVWTALASEVKNKRLRGMIIETSFENKHPEKKLFGHLTPRLLLGELRVLEMLCGGKGSLRGLKIIISHIKPSLNKDHNPVKVIFNELSEENEMGVDFIFPVQGERYVF
ncbi:3',5'-cyclic-nucleotide phosphodiesterase [Salmonella enterica subsp. enterica serovar Give]|nr:3',5'-cyclic-nucleotide phosphodiesterase [Salmonella enterica]EBM9948456.1 3',5'-cyclic-nucleotide phosphodiesterase [Salmonella enterica subsp. enterica serovar Give]ECI4632912.1 3',5'-cyclic-nucleotide phosphodiesterase [Salmonella enterica subsp. enterica serovar Hartford]EDQ6556877.1 3',5'-cyclic-nucleotide phosphodiesterase [Salmonella enterica subsp. enterica]EAS1999939.1 3',5'-cyclic-nucleotide phosphodiesterase [Salmonella enterica]